MTIYVVELNGERSVWNKLVDAVEYERGRGTVTEIRLSDDLTKIVSSEVLD